LHQCRAPQGLPFGVERRGGDPGVWVWPLELVCEAGILTDTAKVLTYIVSADFEDTGEPARIQITDVFDLHSVPPRDVQGVVEAYLEEARRQGFCAIRIVHGRGIGVRREIVRAVLARTRFVVSYRDAPPEAGGWGATIATLDT
jgi:hypothetical protein